MKTNKIMLFAAAALLPLCASADSSHKDAHKTVSGKVIAKQRSALAKSTKGQGLGPQSPRDIDSLLGENNRAFSESPALKEMNLCNIHFHKNAEHKGGEFTEYAGELSQSELKPFGKQIGASKHGNLYPGDTIESLNSSICYC